MFGDYERLILERYHSGIISETKAIRLARKLYEWKQEDRNRKKQLEYKEGGK